ncbi:MAG: L(+)-tartrate dehydratase subunit alpha [Treponema sp.]|nr:L(+)-tartrate dehydratase subunit alpha [Treponema sp.]MCL2271315.1 L(+)-tartrate dehydratase subunit alpha [Treponema sp.]
MNDTEKFINIIEKFINLAAVRLSDDVMCKLGELRAAEDSPVQKAVYDSYFENFKMAIDKNCPCCQDTGMLQFYIKSGTAFPHIDITEDILTQAVRRATSSVPLRPNAVNIFDEKNTGDNTGERCPWISWEIVPGCSEMEITLYFSGAGCSLPGQAKVFKPSDGLEAIIPYVCEIITGPGVNACPPLLVGIGLGHNIENAALLSKKALLRRMGTEHPHPKGAALEKRITEKLNSLGMGAQGLRGNRAVMGVHIESSARHTATIACAVNVSCYALRRGIIRLKGDLSYELVGYKGASL